MVSMVTLLNAFLATALIMLWIQRTGESKHVMELQMVYRFSEEAQKLEKERGRGSSFNLSGHGESMKSTRATAAFHGLLHRQDQRRIMTTINPVGTLSFASGNLTMNYGEDYGWLHYTIINIGTPNVSFLVALDTGSDLLWVPCECRQCALKIANNQPLDLPLNMYHPAASKTSQRITCTDDLCESSEICQDKNDDCLYNVRYVSPNTWTSGVLVEDIIYLSSGRDLDGSVGTRIVFGCGQVQSGNFLSNGAPDGLLGLGMGTIAFPYRLAKAGLIKNSFSMCFASDGSGRIFFGDKGLASQKTTPFLPLNGTHLRYVVGLQSIVVGSSDIQQRTTIIIDSGTSFTYLPKDLYSAVTIEFDKQVTTNRVTLADVPWKFCYESSDGDMQTPPLSMVFIGGEIFPVYNPLIGIYNANVCASCTTFYSVQDTFLAMVV